MKIIVYLKLQVEDNMSDIYSAKKKKGLIFGSLLVKCVLDKLIDVIVPCDYLKKSPA